MASGDNGRIAQTNFWIATELDKIAPPYDEGGPCSDVETTPGPYGGYARVSLLLVFRPRTMTTEDKVSHTTMTILITSGVLIVHARQLISNPPSTTVKLE